MITFLEWLELKETRQGREGKHHKDHDHSKRGHVAGNPRYSGKGGMGTSQRPQDFRTKQKPGAKNA